MNTYKIIFTREDGTQGTDHFAAINERQARKDFGECYRHSTATIISIELASTNAPATKQQERDTLEKIRKMVEQLGPDSYLATAFEGCFDLAAENIDNDWACSMADRARNAEKRVAELEGEVAEYLDTLLPTDWYSWDLSQRVDYFQQRDVLSPTIEGTMQRTRVSTKEIYCECLGLPWARFTRQDGDRIKTMLLRIGGWKSGSKLEKVPGYGPQRCYHRSTGND